MKKMYATARISDAILPPVLLLMLVMIALTAVSMNAWANIKVRNPEIVDHIKSEFIYDPAVPEDINVSIDKGIVTLTGKVTNLLARDRAERIAETVRGVRSVINRIEVLPPIDRSPVRLKNDIKDALLFNPATDTYEIGVEVGDGGIVTLTGRVNSWAERELAETVAKGVSGVARINNKINVTQDAKRPDEEIVADIEQRLHWNTLVDDELINVQVKDGIVHLSGTVGSAAEKREARLDSWISGVKAVDSSDLNVVKWIRDTAMRKNKYTPRSDEEIQRAVEDALVYDPRIYAFDIIVDVTKGRVTLKGTVDNIQAKKAATRDVRNTVGVTGIDNQIDVQTFSNLDDDQIAENIRDALLRNPYTEAFEIKVKVNDHKVVLSGTVDSYFEKAEAENVAYNANGVSSVENDLKVNYPDTVVYNPYVYGWSIYDYPWYEGLANTDKSDTEISNDIKTELIWSPFVDSNNINVSVDDGVATLTGTVDTPREYEAAQENAFEGGAISVVNKLNIRDMDRLFIGTVDH